MIALHRRYAFVSLTAASASMILAASCFVSIDESKIVDDQPPTQDAAAQDADASMGPDADAAVDHAVDAGPEADSTVDGPADGADATEASWPDVATEGGDLDASDAEPDDADWVDAPLVECHTDFDCPPVGCTARTCDNNVCKSAGLIHEDVATFELPAPLACSQGYNRGCVVAARNYLVALTASGFVAFNILNPLAVRQESIPDIGLSAYSYLVRSGERVWAVQPSGNTTPVAWLDIPLDGVSPFSAPAEADLLINGISARFAAPNDALLLYLVDSVPTGFFARYIPGSPTTLATFPANGAGEHDVVGTSGTRALLHARIEIAGSPSTYQHRFSLQTDITSSSSANSGPYDETTLNNFSPTYGFFNQSRKGAIAWIIARHDGNGWSEVRAYWLLTDTSQQIASSYYTIETFTTQPPSTPEGPLAFINDNTIAAAVISGGASPSPSLDVVQKAGSDAPKLLKRIPISALSPGALSVAGDNGYAYVVTGTTVRIFAPACTP